MQIKKRLFPDAFSDSEDEMDNNEDGDDALAPAPAAWGEPERRQKAIAAAMRTELERQKAIAAAMRTELERQKAVTAATRAELGRYKAVSAVARVELVRQSAERAEMRLQASAMREAVGFCSLYGCGYVVKEDLIELGCCGRGFCKACLRGFAKGELDVGRPPKCPECKQIIRNDDLAKVDAASTPPSTTGPSSFLAAKLNMQLRLRTGLTFACKRGCCEALINVNTGCRPDVPGGHSLAVCQRCSAPHCVSCQLMDPRGACDPLPQQTRDAEARMALAVGNIKICPSCAIPIERTAGCNSLQCDKCNHVFCWLCGTVTGTPEDEKSPGLRNILVHDHYKDYTVLNDGPHKAYYEKRWIQCRSQRCIGWPVGTSGFVEYAHPPLERMLTIMFGVAPKPKPRPELIVIY